LGKKNATLKIPATFGNQFSPIYSAYNQEGGILYLADNRDIFYLKVDFNVAAGAVDELHVRQGDY
jgi:hypothetical protein